MRAAAAICVLGITAGIAPIASLSADSPAQTLFNLVRDKILGNIERVPRYTCVETVTRVSHRPQYGNRPTSCAGLIAARAQLSSPGLLTWHDRLRLDVAVGKDSEMFSWAGAASFETGAMNDLAATGATGSGAFSSFLASVFGHDAEQFRYVGDRETPFGMLATFEYVVPEAKSHYTYRTGVDTDRIIGYHGTFYVISGSGTLRRLEVVADRFPAGDACQVIDTMDYTTVKIGSGDFILPEVSTMDVIYSNGEEARNETRFSGCREYVGESTIRFDDAEDTASSAAVARAALKALPPKTRIRVKIDPPIDTETAAAGDPIIGVVEHEVKEKGQVVVRTTDRLHGRLLRLEQNMLPAPKWTVAIRFDSIERDGVTQPVTFKPVDDGDRSPAQVSYGGRRGRVTPVPVNTIKRPPGTGVFILPATGNLILDQKFHTEWETR
jgi:hypothetical protein